jgi:hypothetical protein
MQRETGYTTMQTPPQNSPQYPQGQPPMAPGPRGPRSGLGHLALVFSSGKRVALLKERSFLRKDIPDLFPSTGDPAVAVVRENPSDPNILGLTNCSKTEWAATMPDGSQRQIEPGKSIRLVPGMVIVFGNQSQAQVQPLASGSAFFAAQGKNIGIGVAAFVVIAVILFALMRGGGSVDASAAIAKAKQAVVYIENSKGSGSGFFIDDQGHALTNHHVTGDDTTVTVILNGGKKVTAKVLKTDATLDVSLVAVDVTGNPYLPMKNLDELKEGNDLWTIGYPLGSMVSNTDSSVAKGVFSGWRDAKSNFPELPCYPDSKLILTDATINHGNSGGAIVTDKGEVAGISRLIRRELPGQPENSQAVTGLNYGIPLNEVRKRFLPGTPCAGLALP